MARLAFTRAAAGAAAALLPTAGFAAEGMPQLNFANPLTTSQVVWMFIIFLALYLLLGRWALPQVAAVVESRAASISADLDAARQAKTESDAAVAEVAEATRRAHAEAQARINEAVAAAKAEANERARSFNADMEQRLAEAEARIAEARRDAVGALHQVAAETAQVVVARLTGQETSRGEADATVARLIAARAA
jgi:F-type H+-transporting ATPase subunit b